jgi:hypothetical protein
MKYARESTGFLALYRYDFHDPKSLCALFVWAILRQNTKFSVSLSSIKNGKTLANLVDF